MYVMYTPEPKNMNKIINISMTEEELKRMFINKEYFNDFLNSIEKATGIMLPRL